MDIILFMKKVEIFLKGRGRGGGAPREKCRNRRRELENPCVLIMRKVQGEFCYKKLPPPYDVCVDGEVEDEELELFIYLIFACIQDFVQERDCLSIHSG